MEDGRPAILLSEGRAGWRWTRGFVEDVVRAIALAVVNERAAGQVYNVGEPKASKEEEWVGDSTRIRRELGCREEVERPEALERTARWGLANPPEEGPPPDYPAEDAVLELFIGGGRFR